MSVSKSGIGGFVLATLVAAQPGCAASPSVEPISSQPIGHEEALDRDAAWLAGDNPDDQPAMRAKLDLQLALGPLRRKLRELYAERFVGASTQVASGESYVRLVLQGSAPAAPLPDDPELQWIPIVIQTGAPYTGSQLQAIIAARRSEFMRAVPGFSGAFVDQATGEVTVLYLVQAGRATDTMKAELRRLLNVDVVLLPLHAPFSEASLSGSGRHVSTPPLPMPKW